MSPNMEKCSEKQHLLYRSVVLFTTLLMMTSAHAQTCSKIQGCNLIIDDNCYTHVDNNINWNQAEECCVAWGGHLTSIHSADTNILLNDIRNQARFTWIGLRKTNTDYIWTDGTIFDYNNSTVRQLDSISGELCFHFINNEIDKSNLGWNYKVCTSKSWGSVETSYICQKTINAFGKLTGSTYSELANKVLTSDATLFCVTEKKETPQVMWSYVDLAGNKSDLTSTSTTDINTGICSTQVYTTKPGYYTCEVSWNGGMNTTTYTAIMAGNKLEFLEESTTINSETANAFLDSLEQPKQGERGNSSDDNELLTTNVAVIEQIVEKTIGRFHNETTMRIVLEFDTIIQSTNTFEQHKTELRSILSLNSVFPFAIKTLEKLSKRLLKEALLDEGDSMKQVSYGSVTIIFQVVALNSTNMFPGNTTLSLPIETGGNYSVSLAVPFDVAQDLAVDGRLAVSMSIINSGTSNVTNEIYQASDIFTISIGEKNGTIYLNKEVSIVFDVAVNPEGSRYVCAFLNGSNWDTTGLTTVVETEVIVCKTRHFTSFAVLVTSYEEQPGLEDTVFSIFSYVLVSISFLSLSISLILFICAGKDFFKVEMNIIYFHYCISLLIATGVFLFGIETGKFNEIVCIIIAFVLHYTWLAVFTWTFCIGIFIMLKLMLCVISTRKIYPYLIVTGWGFPLIIPIVTLVITNTNTQYGYVDPSRHCFLNYEDGIIWYFIAPVLTILSTNVVLLVISIFKIIHAKWGKQKNKNITVLKDALITMLVLSVILGIPWLLLILNVSIQHTVLEFIFIFLNGLIGLVFLLVVVVRNKEVQVICCRRMPNTKSANPIISSSKGTNDEVSIQFNAQPRDTVLVERVNAGDSDIENTITNKWLEM